MTDSQFRANMHGTAHGRDDRTALLNDVAIGPGYERIPRELHIQTAASLSSDELGVVSGNGGGFPSR